MVTLQTLAPAPAHSVTRKPPLRRRWRTVGRFVPRPVWRALISLLILFHFGGILAAVFSVPPQPWLASVAWTYVYRPYLEFFYLTNAYHFYAPEPGPATNVWFFVKFDDGQIGELRIPRRADHVLALEYQRRLSLSESVNQLPPALPVVPADVRYRRLEAGQSDGIPLHPDVPENAQFREPTPYSKRMLQSYARFAARTVKHPTDPTRPVVGVKIYRAVHSILPPWEIAKGRDPADPTLYYPFYQGEYDVDGNLKDPADPYLYWLIPVFKPAQVRNQAFVSILAHAPDEDSDGTEFFETHLARPTAQR